MFAQTGLIYLLVGEGCVPNKLRCNDSRTFCFQVNIRLEFSVLIFLKRCPVPCAIGNEIVS